MLAGWNSPTSTIAATTARTIPTTTVEPVRKFHARPSWMSWASSTGPRAHDVPRVSRQAQTTSPAPYATKNANTVTAMVTRPEVRLNSSSTPYKPMTSPSTAASDAAATSGAGALNGGADSGGDGCGGGTTATLGEPSRHSRSAVL